MLFSKSFIFTKRNISSDIHNKSYKIMLKSCLIAQEANGIFYFLPLAQKILQNIEKIIDKHFSNLGLCRLIMPTIQSTDLWKSSGRYHAYGKETLRIRDRHDKEFLYAPTAEEGAFLMAGNYIRSYRDLDKFLYQIHWKFRDEISPRNGLLRSREFLMFDGYSFHKDFKSSVDFYLEIFNIYVGILKEIGIADKCVFAAADAGAIGSSDKFEPITHEIILLSETGDCNVWYGKNSFLEKITTIEELILKQGVVEGHLKKENQVYAENRGIEIGHIFNYADKYAKDMKVFFTDNTGNNEPMYGGCYGIGVSRLLAAIIEAYGDEDGAVWPESIAPFKYHIVYNKDLKKEAFEIYEFIGYENSLIDDRDLDFVTKLKDADLLGMPYQIILGKKIEKKCRKTKIIKYFHTLNDLKDSLNS